MKDIIRLPQDLGKAIHQARKAAHLKATTIAERSGRSRNVLYRLERGEDVTVASLLDILRAMGLTLRLERLGMPTLEEVQQRFAADDDDEHEGPGHAA
ncbi:MAG: helix-turn-helix transcriptional regulator [Pseudomonadota bacterium]